MAGKRGNGVVVKGGTYKKSNKAVKKGNTNSIKSIANDGSNSRRRNFSPPVNGYYLDVAAKLKAARYILLFLLLVFVIVSTALNSKELTIDNINYLLRYIDIQSHAKPQTSEIVVDIDNESVTGYYKNSIVTLKRNKLDIYDLNGRRSFSQKLAYSEPVLSISDRYILTYDSGVNKMQIFNSFSKVYEYKGETPVYVAKITDKGNVVYATSDKGYKSVIKVMDSSFGEKYICSFNDKWIIDVDIDSNAKKLLVADFVIRDGDYLGEVLLYETNAEECKKEITSPGEIPLGVKFNSNGFFTVFENSIKIFDKNGVKLQDYNFGSRSIELFRLTSEFAAVVLNEKTLGSENKIIIFDCSGNLVYSEAFRTDITDMCFSKNLDMLYFLTKDGLYEIDIYQQKFELVNNPYDETSNKIIYADEKNIFVVGLKKINIIGKIEKAEN